MQNSIYYIYKKTALMFFLATVFMVSFSLFHVIFVSQKSIGDGVKEREVSGAETTETVENADEKVQIGNLFFSTTSSTSEYIWIPVPEGVGASDVVIENHYLSNQLWIDIKSDAVDFYSDSYISGNIENIRGGVAEASETGIVLKLDMEKVYEYNTIFENGYLYVEKLAPSAVYDRIVIIDPAGFAPDEFITKESLTPSVICSDIASKLKTLLENEEIKVYMTSLDDSKLSEDDRIGLMEEIHPDMYVRIETSYNEDTKIYGTETVYNGTYFIPGFGSVELADLLESNVTTSIGGRVEGMTEAGEDDLVIKNAIVPAATVKVGYFTNMQENILLNRDDYRTKIAQGMFNAIMQGFGEGK